jgi:hypothetical protein
LVDSRWALWLLLCELALLGVFALVDIEPTGFVIIVLLIIPALVIADLLYRIASGSDDDEE